MEIDEESDDHKLRNGVSRFSNDLRTERKNTEYDTVLDYSNMAKLKDYMHMESKVSKLQISNRIKLIREEVRDMKKTFLCAR